MRCVRGAGPEGKTALTLVIIIHAYFCWSEVSPSVCTETEKLFAREERSSASLDHVSSEKLSTAIKVREPEDLDFFCFHSSPSAPFCFYSFCLLDDV